MIFVNFTLVVILILLTAFFVSTEFAIVKVRTTRINQLIEEGNQRAVSVKKIIDNLDGYLSACQLGITVTALGLGWLGEHTLGQIIRPILDAIGVNPAVSPVITVGLAFLLMTFLHVVVGELAPKTIAIQKAEATVLLLAKPLIAFYVILYPFIWVLNGSARLLVRVFGINPVDGHEVAHSEEELRSLLSESYKSGEINKLEMTYMNNIFEFDDRLAKEIMVPRTEMVCLYKEDTYEENLKIMSEGQYTRFPVADEDKDDIIGLVNVKHVFTGYYSDKEHSIESYIRPILHISEVTPIKQALRKMQKERIHMAIVIDEYGGTAGLVTVEDILEEIVGEIRDEFDVNEQPMIERIDNRTVLADGKLRLKELDELLNTDITDDEVDTIGGWLIMNDLESEQGTMIEHNGFQFVVEEIENYQVKKVKIVSLERDI